MHPSGRFHNFPDIFYNYYPMFVTLEVQIPLVIKRLSLVKFIFKKLKIFKLGLKKILFNIKLHHLCLMSIFYYKTKVF